jgi:plasmid stability protein
MSAINSVNKVANDDKDRFILRFHDEGQRAAMKARAAANKRSMNSEILVLIEQGLASIGSTFSRVGE